MSDFYSKMLEYKTLNRLTWGHIGEVINKNEAATRVAFNKKATIINIGPKLLAITQTKNSKLP